MIVLTGGAGFIGRHVFARLAADRKAVMRVDPRLAIQLWDWMQAPDTVSAVIHLGAISDTTCRDWEALLKVNFGLSRKLALWCKKHRKPFVYASSASVYGNGRGPINEYAESKWLFDQWAEMALDDLWWGARLFNVYGSGEESKGEQASMISRMIWDAKAGRRTKLFAAETERDWVYIEDVVDVLMWMLDGNADQLGEDVSCGIYDVGSGEPVAFHRAHEMIGDMVGRNLGRGMWLPYEQIEMPKGLRGRYQFDTKSKNPFGRSLAKGLAEMLAPQRVVVG